jgi:hypothetical protein
LTNTEISWASSVEEAEQLLQQHSFEAVLLDAHSAPQCRLPVMRLLQREYPTLAKKVVTLGGEPGTSAPNLSSLHFLFWLPGDAKVNEVGAMLTRLLRQSAAVSV